MPPNCSSLKRLCDSSVLPAGLDAPLLPKPKALQGNELKLKPPPVPAPAPAPAAGTSSSHSASGVAVLPVHELYARAASYSRRRDGSESV